MQSSSTGTHANGESRLVQLSSNSTLFWRVFTPVFGTVFLAALVMAVWSVSPDDVYSNVPVYLPRIIVITLLLAWLVLLKQTIWRLKRADSDDAHLYVTNYWTTVRYPWADVESIEKVTRLGRSIIQIKLKAPGRFGDKISFLEGSNFQKWYNSRKTTE